MSGGDADAAAGGARRGQDRGSTLRASGLALAGGGPLGGIYEVGALLALAESLDGIDFERSRRLRRRVVGRLRRRGARRTAFRRAQMYRLFIDDGADAALTPVALPASRVRANSRAGALRSRGSLAEATAALPARPLRRGRWIVRDARRGRSRPACSTTARSTLSLRGCSPTGGRTNDFRQLRRKLFLVATDLDTGAR